MTMIHIEKNYVGDIPLLQVVQVEKRIQPLKTVVYYHGFNGEKESSLTIAYKIAEKGYRVLLPDSIFHGERQNGLSLQEKSLSFWNIVMQNIRELEDIYTFYAEENLILPEQIGIGGTSMGGITTYGVLNEYDWIKAGAVLMGTPEMTNYAKILIDQFNETNKRQITEEEVQETLSAIKEHDLSRQTEKLNDRPLLIWHGDKDPVVPVAHSKKMYEKAKESYEQKENVKCIIEQGRSHHISALSIDETAKWFATHL